MIHELDFGESGDIKGGVPKAFSGQVGTGELNLNGIGKSVYSLRRIAAGSSLAASSLSGYDDPILYPFCKPNYDANTAHFREDVDSYLVPDGINLALSSRIEDLRAIFAAGIVGGFAAFQTSVRAFVGIAGVGGSMTASEKTEIRRSRAWRDQVDNLPGATAPQKAALKVDMQIR